MLGAVTISLSLLLFVLRPDAPLDTTEESFLPLLLLCRMADVAVETREGVDELSLLSSFFLRTGLVSEGRGGKAGHSDGFRFREVTQTGLSLLLSELSPL